MKINPVAQPKHTYDTYMLIQDEIFHLNSLQNENTKNRIL